MLLLFISALESEVNMEEQLITRQVNFTETVQPLTGIILGEGCPLTGTIKSVTMTCCDGANDLVEAAFGHGSEKVCPSDGYIPVQATNPPYTDISESVKMDERLWCEIRNGDDTYEHLIAVLVVIVGKYGDMGV